MNCENEQAVEYVRDILQHALNGEVVETGIETKLIDDKGDISYGDHLTYTVVVKNGRNFNENR